MKKLLIMINVDDMNECQKYRVYGNLYSAGYMYVCQIVDCLFASDEPVISERIVNYLNSVGDWQKVMNFLQEDYKIKNVSEITEL